MNNAEVTSYLKKIHESESLFHTESLTALCKEQDRIQNLLSSLSGFEVMLSHLCPMAIKIDLLTMSN